MEDVAELMSLCKHAKVDVLPEHDKSRLHRIRADCVELLDKRDLSMHLATYPTAFGTLRPPVRASVNVSIASLRMQNEAERMVSWINNYSNKSLETIPLELNAEGELRIADLRSNSDMKRLFVCFIDFNCNQDLMLFT